MGYTTCKSIIKPPLELHALVHHRYILAIAPEGVLQVMTKHTDIILFLSFFTTAVPTLLSTFLIIS